MKTIAQIAAEIGVSVQTIYRTLNKVKHETEECLTEKINGITNITEFGENIVKERLTGVKQMLNIDNEMLNSVKQAESDEIIFLREQNKALIEQGNTLIEQLSAKDKLLEDERVHSREQADKLSDLAAQLAELTRNNQVLLGAEQTRTNPALTMGGTLHEGEGQQRKKGFFQRFFKK